MHYAAGVHGNIAAPLPVSLSSFDKQYLYVIFHLGVTSWTSLQHPSAVTLRKVHVVQAVKNHFRRTALKRGQCCCCCCCCRGHWDLYFFCVLRCFTQCLSIQDFSTLCTNWTVSSDAAVCGLLTKWLLTDAFFSVGAGKLIYMIWCVAQLQFSFIYMALKYNKRYLDTLFI